MRPVDDNDDGAIESAHSVAEKFDERMNQLGLVFMMVEARSLIPGRRVGEVLRRAERWGVARREEPLEPLLIGLDHLGRRRLATRDDVSEKLIEPGQVA
jgi:hypothetical protein